MPCGYKDDAHHLATQKSAGKIGADGHEVETSKEKGTIQGTKNPSGRRRIPIRLAHYSKKDKSWTKPIILDPNTIVYEEED